MIRLKPKPIEATNRRYVISQIVKTHNGYTDDALREIHKFLQKRVING